jgi:hypothetical protein
MSKITISGTGCALADFLYYGISFSSDEFKKYSSRRYGDGGLSLGKLVFASELEKWFHLWWHDFYFLAEEVEKRGIRWIWSDYVWNEPEVFFKKMPTLVLQSNWYYGTKFGPDVNNVKYYNELEKRGYDQVPTGSPHSNSSNF